MLISLELSDDSQERAHLLVHNHIPPPATLQQDQTGLIRLTFCYHLEPSKAFSGSRFYQLPLAKWTRTGSVESKCRKVFSVHRLSSRRSDELNSPAASKIRTSVLLDNSFLISHCEEFYAFTAYHSVLPLRLFTSNELLVSQKDTMEKVFEGVDGRDVPEEKLMNLDLEIIPEELRKGCA
ncbi:hypothetical protein CNMCM5793_003113 [Aspergillus hiratsukae]|uniref:Uncharacterized protein n=1 Tax=Aspergillus hiratsukae TaxID=1194566 RepID=A0A8H6UF78_9EURO|nr:hypothetical protein CNMCM5793_003113 [Aspergillus hiratsukae]